MKHAAHVVLALTVVVGVASGCGAGSGASDVADNSPAASPSTSPDSVLAGRETTGGLCAEGQCTTELVITADGSWSMTDQSGATETGQVDDAALADLSEAVEVTGLEPASGNPVCASAADGQDVTYTFAVDSGTATTDCTSPSRDDPLVQWLDGFAAEVG